MIPLGGQYQSASESLVGPLTRLCIQHVHFSKAFIGVDGFHVGYGFYESQHDACRCGKHILAKGQQNIILTDSSKFGRIHPGDRPHQQRAAGDHRYAYSPRCRIVLQAQGIELDKVSR